VRANGSAAYRGRSDASDVHEDDGDESFGDEAWPASSLAVAGAILAVAGIDTGRSIPCSMRSTIHFSRPKTFARTLGSPVTTKKSSRHFLIDPSA
jgi:hypothetical protein